jgi:adenosylmethionine-8-amino-7-oxononanoate aminotransferase
MVERGIVACRLASARRASPHWGAVPSSSSSHTAWVARDQAVVWHGFTQMATFAELEPVIVERAEGRELIDVEGRRFLDAISSLWVNTLGHRVPELDHAIVEQLAKVAHSTMLGNGNTTVVELAEALAEVVPVDRPHFLFASDGAASVEQALRIAYQYWRNLGDERRRRFVALGAAYHGDTVGALSLGDRGFGTSIFDSLCFEVLRTPGYDHPDWADRALVALRRHADELAALVLEPLVQAASGMLVASEADVRRVVEEAQRLGVIVVADEVATGFGRTGALFASERCGIRPDLLCLGKGITGGYLPMSATAASAKVYEAFLGEDLGGRTLAHGHSYGGNALAAAVALAHLRILMRPGFLDEIAEKGERLGRLLDRRVRRHPLVAEVRRSGLMVGVALVGLAERPGRLGRLVCMGAVRRGVLLRPLGDVVVLMPPLTTTDEELERIVATLEAALDDLEG